MATFILEFVVTPEGAAWYPPVGTRETLPPDNAGVDLKVVCEQLPTDEAVLVPLGVKARMLEATTETECHFTLEPRSSIYKTGFMMANGRGIIDKSYRGELKAPVISVGTRKTPIAAGTRLFQVVAPGLGYIREVRYVATLPETARGEGGFGSTGA